MKLIELFETLDNLTSAEQSMAYLHLEEILAKKGLVTHAAKGIRVPGIIDELRKAGLMEDRDAGTE